MQPPAFWNLKKPNLAAHMLSPLGLLYGWAGELRHLVTIPQRPLVPVLCVGNLTLGGAGKTPVAIEIARRLKSDGCTPGFLSRGYGARIVKPVMVDPKGASASFGDEPLLLARHAKTVCSPDRPAGAQALIDAGCDVVVMDDGFQNPTLAKDLSIVVVDARAGLGNGLVFPAGPLRADLSRQLGRAGGMIVIGEAKDADPHLRMGERRGLVAMRGHIQAEPHAVANLRGKRLVAFAGIGLPEKFFATLSGLELDVVETRVFPDHHVYSLRDAEDLLALADKRDAVLVTTEKDAIRFQASEEPVIARLAAQTQVLPITVGFDRTGAHNLDKLLKSLRANFAPKEETAPQA
ncbi:tetraacyldisaccharide 4'-kinase [Tepidamorphus sp. 3E244]|uniref:tetraacyldisaccharide 4'-kinase n=1 Tax=Tepidamorphus sp. 3E244 TaxID=3385498 RepID=UPI0038FCD7F5